MSIEDGRIGLRLDPAIMQRIEAYRQRLATRIHAISPGRCVTFTDAVVALLEAALAIDEAPAPAPPIVRSASTNPAETLLVVEESH